MSHKRPEDLSAEELRRLLVEKRKGARQGRLEHFRRTGKVSGAFGAGSPFNGSEGSLSLSRSTQRTWTDHLLLGVEMLAVLVLVGIGLNSVSTLRSLNRNALAAFVRPPIVPTPLIYSVVLPEGHTPPNSPGGAQPNDAEIPAHLRPFVQSLPSLPVPTPGSQQAVRIQVPAIGVDAPVVQGDGWEQLKKGVAQHLGTPNPGENGNVVLAGHNDVFGEVFRDLDRLMPGDKVILFTAQQQYTYIVTGTKIVMPTQVEVMDPTPNATVTLISCHPYLVDNHRIVVSAVLQNP